MSETSGLLSSSVRRRPQPQYNKHSVIRAAGFDNSFPAAAAAVFAQSAFLASIPVYAEICTCVILVINSFFAFLEVNIAYSLPVQTWVILVGVQSSFLTFIVGSLHGQIAALLSRPNSESAIALLRQQVGRVSSSWVFSLFANAQILRLYLSVPSGLPLSTLDAGFNSSTVPTFPELALLSFLLVEIASAALYVSEASISAFEVAFSTAAQIAGVSLYKAGTAISRERL